MADAVTSQTIFDGDREVVMKFTNISDGAGETAVLKVDVSTLNPSPAGKVCDGVTLDRIHASINGMSVAVLWDATADVPAVILAPGMYTFNHGKRVQLPNDAGAGKTGDVAFTTIGASAGDTYSIVLEMVKSYAD